MQNGWKTNSGCPVLVPDTHTHMAIHLDHSITWQSEIWRHFTAGLKFHFIDELSALKPWWVYKIKKLSRFWEYFSGSSALWNVIKRCVWARKRTGSEQVLDFGVCFSTQTTTLFIPGFRQQAEQRMECCLDTHKRISVRLPEAKAATTCLKCLKCLKH